MNDIAKVVWMPTTHFTLLSVRNSIFAGDVSLPKPDGLFFPTFGTCTGSQPETMTQVGEQVELGINAERLKIIHALLHDGSAGNGIVVPD